MPELSDTALLAPFRAGQLVNISHGYNDPLPNERCKIGTGPDHCGNQRYGLDLVPTGLQNFEILAPLPGKVTFISGDCLGLRTRDNLNLNICHFANFNVRVNDEVRRGTVLGMRSTTWIHVSLDDRFNHPTKPFPPIPFIGEHTMEGIQFEPGPNQKRNFHWGRTFTSTNGSTSTSGSTATNRLTSTNRFTSTPAPGVSFNDCAQFVKDTTIPDGTHVSPGERFNKGWQLRNCGNTTWNGYEAIRIAGSYGPKDFDVPVVGPGETGELRKRITAPTTPGIHRATYQLSGPGGKFGPEFWVEIVVS